MKTLKLLIGTFATDLTGADVHITAYLLTLEDGTPYLFRGDTPFEEMLGCPDRHTPATPENLEAVKTETLHIQDITPLLEKLPK